MADYYLDTSALVKSYINERGTGWVRALTNPQAGHHVYAVLLIGPELIAALFRKMRNGEVPPAVARRTANNFQTNWLTQYEILAITPQLAVQAMLLVEQYGLRGYDAVHLAAALDLQADRQVQQLPPITFVSADAGQLRAAVAAGLLTDNPDQHP